MSSQFVQDVLGRFDQVSEQEIGAIEGQALLDRTPEEERSLLYALRVSHCVPTLRSLATLASRWNVANQGAADSGLQKGRASPNWQAVHDKLVDLFLSQFDKLAELRVSDANQAETGCTSPSVRDRRVRRAKEEIESAFADFHFELPGLAERADHWLRMLNQVPPRIQGLEVTPSPPESPPTPVVQQPHDPSKPQGVASAVEVDVVHSQTLNFAMEQSGVPIVAAVHIRNRTSEPASDLTFSVALEPDLGESVTVQVSSLRAGEDTDLGPIDIRLPPGRLRAILEAERARLHWTLRSGERVLSTREIEIDLLAYNEWPGARAPSSLLAVFVTPNHPVVTRLLQRVRDQLTEQTGDGSIPGYQKSTKGSVLAQVKALYSALQSLGLSYVGMPASFEKTGQKIRLPDVVLDSQMGNCLDLTVLFASCMEQMGLAPLLVIVRGHAFPGVWLIDERFPEGVIEDAARIRTQLALGQVLLFDSSTSVAAGQPPLEAAVAEAQKYVAADDAFVFALDVRVARTDRYRPLPIRMTVDAAPEGGADEDSHREVVRTLLQEALAEPEPVQAKEPEPPPTTVVARFQRWKERLLDTSLRNRLLNFRRGGSGAIPLRIPDLPGFEDLLAGNTKFELLPRPAQDSRDSRSPELLLAREDARAVRRSPSGS